MIPSGKKGVKVLTFSLTVPLMSTAALPVELLIQIFELTMADVGPEVGVFQQANHSSTSTSGQVAPTESTDDDDDDDEKWDEGYFFSSSDIESEDGGESEISDEPTQSEGDEVQGPNAPGLLGMRRQGDGTVEWSALKTCRL